LSKPDQVNEFLKECEDRIASFPQNQTLSRLSHEWMIESISVKYPYNFNSLGRPIIQYPEDMIAVQELIFSVRPDLIIETGIAHGGSVIQSASQLALLDLVDAIESKEIINPSSSQRKVLAIDIDIRSHNRQKIEDHPMSSRIQMIEGSSTDPEIIQKVKDIAKDYKKIMVMLDSNHVHQHVLEELRLYTPFVTKESYCIVFDTFVENTPGSTFPDRPWKKGNNPMTAVFEFLEDDKCFAIDKSICNKLIITGNPNGYLKRVDSAS
jgi:cephalosporin hydroxylase